MNDTQALTSVLLMFAMLSETGVTDQKLDIMEEVLGGLPPNLRSAGSSRDPLSSIENEVARITLQKQLLDQYDASFPVLVRAINQEGRKELLNIMSTMATDGGQKEVSDYEQDLLVAAMSMLKLYK